MRYLSRWLSRSVAVFASLTAVIAGGEDAQVLSVQQFAQANSDQNSNQFDYKNLEFWSNQCLSLIDEKQYAKATLSCEKAIALQPKASNKELWAARSNALFHTGQYAESLVSYDRVLQVDPKASSAIAYQCAAQLQLDRLEDAVDTCEKALKVDGSWGKDSPAFAFFYRGLALRRLGRLETAAASYKLAKRLKPDDFLIKAELCSTLAEVQNQACNVKDAIADYERGLAAEPSNSALWAQQGLALESIGSYPEALTSYNQALKLRPDSALVLAHRCAVLNALEDYKTAFESCEGALQGDGKWGTVGTAYLWAQRSAALLGLGKFEEALAAADRAVAIDSKYAPGLNSRAVSLWQLTRYREAKAAIVQTIDTYAATEPIFQNTFERIYPDALTIFNRGRIFAWFNRGRILASLKDYLGAKDAYDRSIAAVAAYQQTLNRSELTASASLNPSGGLNLSEGLNTIDRRLLANIYANQGAAYLHLSADTNNGSKNLNEATKATQRAIELNPASFAAWYNQGLILAKQAKYCEALKAYTRAAQLSPNNPYVVAAQGVALESAGQTQQAITVFNQLLNLDPNNALAKKRLDDLTTAPQKPSTKACD